MVVDVVTIFAIIITNILIIFVNIIINTNIIKTHLLIIIIFIIIGISSWCPVVMTFQMMANFYFLFFNSRGTLWFWQKKFFCSHPAKLLKWIINCWRGNGKKLSFSILPSTHILSPSNLSPPNLSCWLLHAFDDNKQADAYQVFLWANILQDQSTTHDWWRYLKDSGCVSVHEVVKVYANSFILDFMLRVKPIEEDVFNWFEIVVEQSPEQSHHAKNCASY